MSAAGCSWLRSCLRVLMHSPPLTLFQQSRWVLFMVLLARFPSRKVALLAWFQALCHLECVSRCWDLRQLARPWALLLRGSVSCPLRPLLPSPTSGRGLSETNVRSLARVCPHDLLLSPHHRTFSHRAPRRSRRHWVRHLPCLCRALCLVAVVAGSTAHWVRLYPHGPLIIPVGGKSSFIFVGLGAPATSALPPPKRLRR